MEIEEFGDVDRFSDDSDYSYLINALSADYLNVYFVEPENNRASIIKLDGYITKGILSAPKLFDYDEMLQKYMENRVYHVDKDMFYTKLCAKTLLEVFRGDAKKIEFTYRVVENDGLHYYSAQYSLVSLPNRPLKIVAGFRNVDDIVLDQLKQKEDGIYKAYKALSSVYLSMYRIDLVADSFHEVKGTALVQQSLIPGNLSYKENIVLATKATTNPAYVDRLLEFVNPVTLPERMKEKNCISMEFLSKVYGYCKANYIKEDEDADGNLWHVLYAVEVIDENKKKEEILRQMAERDPLTNIYNRRYGEMKFKEKLEEKEEGIFCILDCDHFKDINDRFGHDVGDMVLIHISKCLLESTMKDDIIMRLGGDEFAIFAHGTRTKEDVDAFWKKFNEKLEQIEIPQLHGERIYLSAGVYFIGSDKKHTFTEVYKEADKAMYRSKANNGHSLEFAI